MAKKTVRPSSPAGETPTPTRRRASTDAPRARAGARTRSTTPAGTDTPVGNGASREPQSISTTPAGARTDRRTGDPSYDEIARRAYFRFLQRGSQHGDPERDWYEAERELRDQES